MVNYKLSFSTITIFVRLILSILFACAKTDTFVNFVHIMMSYRFNIYARIRKLHFKSHIAASRYLILLSILSRYSFNFTPFTVKCFTIFAIDRRSLFQLCLLSLLLYVRGHRLQSSRLKIVLRSVKLTFSYLFHLCSSIHFYNP